MKVNLLNKKFGKLLVIQKLASSRGGSSLWLCQCDCGNQINVSTRHLNRKNNNVKSCGCLRKLKGSEHKDWKGYGEISGDWWSTHIYRETSQTARVKVEVTITIKEAWELFLKQNKKCNLSGLPLNFGKYTYNNTASLDRIDSSKGYTLDNVQWVHKHINFMKRTYSQEYFIEMCMLVSNHNKEIGGVCPVK